MLFCSSPRVRPCRWECSFHPLWVRSSYPLWVRSSVIHHAVLDFGIIQSGHVYLDCWFYCLDELLARPRADPRVLLRTFSHVLRVVWWSPSTTLPPPPRAARVEGVFPEPGCSGSAFFSAWSWVPPCRVCDHSRPSSGTLRRWSLCLEGLYRKRRSAPFVRHCSAWLPAIVHCGPPSFHALTCGLLD